MADKKHPLFGMKIVRDTDSENKSGRIPAFAEPENVDAAYTISGGGAYSYGVDLNKNEIKNEVLLITRYREMAMVPECDRAVDDIVNEAIVTDKKEMPVKLMLDEVKTVSEPVKKKIQDAFREILTLLKMHDSGYDIFKKWYVDGRIYFHVMIDVDKPKEGIKELRYIDPRKIKKVRVKEKDVKATNPFARAAAPNDDLFQKYLEYYIYAAKGVSDSNKGLKISTDSIVFCHSGIYTKDNGMILSHLHKAIKPLTNLTTLEDSTIIYRLSRAPSRRVFYIDVGSLPKPAAEQYMRDIMARHKNKLVYDPSNGQIKDDRKFMTMLEDYWFPRREGGRGTEVSTLEEGKNLGEIEDVLYFKKKLYESLNVPFSRLDTENAFNVGRSTEITRDEVKFARFIGRLRTRFSQTFTSLLEKQLLLKGIITSADWEEMRGLIYYDFLEDNHYSELKDAEILRERLQLLNDIDPFVGKYFSPTWVRTTVLKQSEEDMEQQDKEIEEWKKSHPDEYNVHMEIPPEEDGPPNPSTKPDAPKKSIVGDKKGK